MSAPPTVDILGIAQKAATILALVVGGAWALFNYYANRTHRPRIQFRISGERVLHGGLEHLIIRAELRNVGLSRVDLSQTARADVYVARAMQDRRAVRQRRLEDPITFPLFRTKEHLARTASGKSSGAANSPKLYLEPNSLATDELLIAIPEWRDRFVLVEGYVSHGRVAWRSDVVLAPRATQPLAAPDDNTLAASGAS